MDMNSGGMESTVFCAVDVETSGLYMGSRLVELGAVRFTAAGPIDEYHTLVDPMEPIQQAAIDIHGISDDMVCGCPHPSEVVREFGCYLGDAVFIAHNARFDVRVIGMELARAGMEPPVNHVVDTVIMARRTIPGLPNYRLGTVAAYLEIDQVTHHRGLPDAVAAMEIFRHCLQEADACGCVEEAPGYLGPFADLAPRIEIELSGAACDIMVLAERKVVVEMVYEGGSDPGIPRMVTPLQVFGHGTAEYFRAYCHRSGMVKTFRLDRVIELRLP